MASSIPLTDQQRSHRATRAAAIRWGDNDKATRAAEDYERSRLESEVLHLLMRTRTDRGMALVIDDPAIIAQVASIVGGAPGDGPEAA